MAGKGIQAWKARAENHGESNFQTRLRHCAGSTVQKGAAGI